jgi:uncharacterized protein (TIGR02246 family)
MKQILTSAFILVMSVFATHVKAQISDNDKEDVKKVYEAAAAAFKNMDAMAMSNIFIENGAQIDPMGKIIRGKANLLTYFTGLFSYFKSLPKPDKTTTNVSDWDSRSIAPGITVATYTEETVTTTGDKTGSSKYSFSLLLVKKNGKWLAEQVTLTPVINMVMQ